jgi:hypothetical protein
MRKEPLTVKNGT